MRALKDKSLDVNGEMSFMSVLKDIAPQENYGRFINIEEYINNI